MTEGKNFRGQATPSIIEGVKKGVRLFPGDDTPRTFISCNMVNCEPPPDSTQIGCNNAIVERDVVYSMDDLIEIDGEVISGTQLKDVCYGKYENGAYLYFPSPKKTLHEGVI